MARKNNYEKLFVLVLCINRQDNHDFKDAKIVDCDLLDSTSRKGITIEVTDSWFNKTYYLLSDVEQKQYLQIPDDELEKSARGLIGKIVYAHNHQRDKGSFVIVINYLNDIVSGGRKLI